MIQKGPSATILYHFFYPDDVVSARHFSDFAEELVNRGWQISLLTSNRYCRYPRRKIPIKEENWKGLKIIRIGRPGWNQANNFSRVMNSLWMMIGWTLRLLRMPRTDAVIVGSDPQFSQLLLPVLKFFKVQSILVYWCYDLYPEAILADGASGPIGGIVKKLPLFLKRIYDSVDLIVDIGICMRRKLDAYKPKAVRATLTPWALVEPERLKEPDLEIRHEIFGHARLALLYSGNMGRVHDFSLFLKLARRIYRENPGIIFCLACRGNRLEELRKAINPDDDNIRLAPFVEEFELEKRLNAADIHLLSLRPEWEGIVVPSNFFGSLALGKPVIYAGPKGSAIADWIHELNVGLTLTSENLEQVTRELLQIAEDPGELQTWRENAFDAYT